MKLLMIPIVNRKLVVTDLRTLRSIMPGLRFLPKSTITSLARMVGRVRDAALTNTSSRSL